MRRPTRRRRAHGAAFLILIAAAFGCVDDQVVYVNRTVFEDPPVGAGGFLGYTDVEGKQTTCGNCHIGKQRDWQTTAHASAWAGLQASGSAQAFCEGCHTVSSRGNVVTEEDAGWVATGDPRYQDVQCEACHGPGLGHVMDPDAADKPLAPLRVGVDLSLGCGQCHSGVHRPFAEEWSASRHGQVQAYPAGRPECAECHEAKAVLEAWGVNATFLEQVDPETSDQHIPITCAVCHDPHDARNEGQLRFAMSERVVERNLCMKCHHKRGEPDPTTFRGPHSPEGPLLLGTGGWWPPNMRYIPGSIVSTHGSDANPRLCAGCHVNDFEFRDAATDEFVFRATGHSFEAIPCVDAEGVPAGTETCDLAERSFRSCASCHGSETQARLALEGGRTEVAGLVAQLESLIAQIPAEEFDDTDTLYTTGEGATFNKELAQVRGSVVHNPLLLKALLRASIEQIEIDYGLTASPNLSPAPERAPAP